MMDEERWASSRVEQGGREKSGEARRRRRCGMGGKDIAPVLDNLPGPGRVGDHKTSVIVDDHYGAGLRKKRISSGKNYNCLK